MWKLSIEDDEGNLTSLPLHHDEYGLGRAEANSIRLTDRNISRKHAKLRRNGQGWLLADQQSYNGTYVNGVRVVGEQLLQPGDVIQLGDYRVELVDEVAAQPAAPGAPAVAAAPTPGHHRPDRLVVVVGPTPGAEFPLDREYLSIGRAEDATISINHSSVSRLHAEIVALGNGRYEVVDKGSANGIRINGVELKRGILEAGDALELGDVRLRFVGAGKLLRSTIDPGAFIAAGTPFDPNAASTRAPSARAASTTKIIAIGVGIVAIAAIVGVVAMRGSNATAQPEPTSSARVVVPTDDASAKLLKEARDLLDRGDYEAAHAKVLQIPENSAARDDDVFKKVESGWADSLFAQAESALDADGKRRLLTMITSTGTVDGQRRAKALDLLNQLDAASPPASARPQWNGVATAPGAGGPIAAAPATAKTADPPAPGPAAPPPAPGAPDEAAIRKSLEPKVWAGKGTVNDIKMLKAICSHMGDRACRDRAGAMLKAKLEGN
jgi:pSer/pThr/pTyr-binding forkhead associated (FHA) protein